MKNSTKNAIYLLIILCLGIVIFAQHKAANRPCPPQINPVISLDCSDYEIALQHIKNAEGFRSTPDSKEGQSLVGYGFSRYVCEQKPMTEKDADIILRKQYDKAIYQAYRETRLQGRKLLAVACLIYNLKPASWQKSTLKKIVTSDDKERITAAWMSLCNAGGKKMKGLEKRRQWELNYFMSNK